MSITKLAFLNFKRNLSTYLALILSLAFTVLILLNFLNLIYADNLSVLPQWNKQYIDTIVEVISIVLVCFMFFFIWYATNVFLNRRKKEIGIFVFMGLDNKKIGMLYLLETLFTGGCAMALGIVAGVLFTGLFQMILLSMSEIAVVFSFDTSPRPVLITLCAFIAIYGLFALKGYVNITRCSVIDMIAAGKKQDATSESSLLLALKAFLGLGLLVTGYYFAVKNSGQEIMMTVPTAVVLVIAGVYLLFGGFFPYLFRKILQHKHFLYQKTAAPGQRLKERSPLPSGRQTRTASAPNTKILWVNNVAYRMKKNYRAYAITCILMLCSVTALASGFAVKNQYENRVRFRSVYTFQFLMNYNDINPKTTKPLLEEKIAIDNVITSATQADILALDPSLIETRFTSSSYAILSYSQMQKLAEDAGLTPLTEEPGENEIIKLEHVTVLSLYTDALTQSVKINGTPFTTIAASREPYMGYLQEIWGFYIVNDAVYESLLPLGQKLCVYSYQLADPDNMEASLDDLATVPGRENIGCVKLDAGAANEEWIKVLYSLCVFLFLVFILASASILFMKLYNDAFEDRERFAILQKMGCNERTLKKAIAQEINCAYTLPFIVMTVSAYFSVHALEKMMRSDLMPVYVISVLIVLGFFLLFNRLSVFFAVKIDT